MKLIFLGTCVTAMAVSTSVFAAGAFEGPYMGVGIGPKSQNTKLTDAQGDEVDGLGKNTFFGKVLGGYSMNFDKFNLGANVFYNIGTTTSNVVTPGGIFNGSSVEVKWKNQFGVEFQPGYYLGDSTLGYLKLSWQHMKAELQINTPSGSANPSDSFNGFGVGIGMKHAMDKNVFLWVDFEQTFFSSKTYSTSLSTASIEAKPKQTLGTFGVGYQF